MPMRGASRHSLSHFGESAVTSANKFHKICHYVHRTASSVTTVSIPACLSHVTIYLQLVRSVTNCWQATSPLYCDAPAPSAPPPPTKWPPVSVPPQMAGSGVRTGADVASAGRRWVWRPIGAGSTSVCRPSSGHRPATAGPLCGVVRPLCGAQSLPGRSRVAEYLVCSGL